MSHIAVTMSELRGAAEAYRPLFSSRDHAAQIDQIEGGPDPNCRPEEDACFQKCNQTRWCVREMREEGLPI